MVVVGLALGAFAAGQPAPSRTGERALVLQRRIASLRAEQNAQVDGRLRQAELALQAASTRQESGEREAGERAYRIAEASLDIAASRIENARLRAAIVALERDRIQLEEQQSVVDSAIAAAERALQHEPREVPRSERSAP